MTVLRALINQATRRGVIATFECEDCWREHPDVVGTITCDCGRTIETTDADFDVLCAQLTKEGS